MERFYNTVEEYSRYYLGSWHAEPKVEDTTYEIIDTILKSTISEKEYKAIGGQNLFNTEPEEQCLDCGQFMYTEWIDNGFGPFSVQVEPYHCTECGWDQNMPFSHVPKNIRPTS